MREREREREVVRERGRERTREREREREKEKKKSTNYPAQKTEGGEEKSVIAKPRNFLFFSKQKIVKF